MKTMKRIISFILCTLMFFSLFSVSITAFANEMPEEDGFCGESAQYTLGQMSGQLTIFGSGIIDEGFFRDRTDIKSVVIESNITQIGKNAFRGCTAIEEVRISGTKLQRINDFAFYECTALREINIPVSVSYVGAYAFASCLSLEEIALPIFLNRIEDYCFNSCDSLKSVKLGSMIESIGSYAFGYCTSLTDINLPEAMKEFESSVFTNCQSLKSISIPDFEMREYEHNYFPHCYALEEIVIPEDSPYYSVLDGVLYNSDKTVLLKYPAGKEDKSFRVPDSVKEISPFAFAYSKLSEIILPDGIERIREDAFFACHNIEGMKLPDSLTQLGARAFSECINLKSIVIPENTERISGGLFENCLRLESVTFKNSAGEIDEDGGIFDRCFSLSEIVNLSDSVICDDYYGNEDEYAPLRKITPENPMTLEENILYLERFIILNDYYTYSNVSQDKDSFISMLSDLYDRNFSSVEEYTTWKEENFNRWYSPELPDNLVIVCKENSAQHDDCIENSISHSIICLNDGKTAEDCDIRCGKHLEIYENDDIAPSCISVGYKGGVVCLVCGEKDDEERRAAAVIEPAQPYGEIQPHTPVVLPGDEPTCSRPGYGEFTACYVCGKVLVEPELIEPTDHVDKNGDNLCDECGMIVNEKPEKKTIGQIVAEFFANAFSRILSIFKKIFG